MTNLFSIVNSANNIYLSPSMRDKTSDNMKIKRNNFLKGSFR